MKTFPKALVGHIGVDAGMVMVGDPCYTIGSDCVLARMEKVSDFDQFLAKYITDNDRIWHVGGDQSGALALVASSGWGDGVYPVYATFTKEGRVKSLTIEFIEDGEG